MKNPRTLRPRRWTRALLAAVADNVLNKDMLLDMLINDMEESEVEDFCWRQGIDLNLIMRNYDV